MNRMAGVETREKQVGLVSEVVGYGEYMSNRIEDMVNKESAMSFQAIV